MKRDDLIELAKKAGFLIDNDSRKYQQNCINATYWLIDANLQKFAALVAENTREECARRLDAVACDHCAENIRNIGKTPIDAA